MKNVFLPLFLILTTSLNTFAGNGVERGRIVFNSSNDLNIEITNYVEGQLSRCTVGLAKGVFNLSKIEERKERIDQGITDIYYLMSIQHLDENGNSLNQIEIEVLDSDFSNWRNYEEKLSIEFKADNNNMCK